MGCFADNLAAQIGFFDGGGVQQLLAGAGGDDLTGLQNVATVCDLQSGPGVLFHQQDGGAVLVQFLDNVKDLLHQDGSQAHGGLVQHQQFGMAHKRAAHGQHLLLAARQGAGDLLAALLQTGEELEKIFTYFPRLKERRRQVAGTLSGGEQQMLAMGRALMSSPQLLMLDEPSMGLAPILVEQIFEIIRELHKAGTTILLVEQNAQAALSVADRGYVLETGKIVTSGTGEELLNSPAIKKAYLGG